MRELLSFGFEFGNARGFTASPQLVPLSRECMPEDCLTESSIPGDLTMRVGERWEGSGQTWIKTTEFTALEPGVLFDAVARFVVLDLTGRRPGFLNLQEIPHDDSGLYHQAPGATVTVPLDERAWLTFSGKDFEFPGQGFEHVIYLRGEGKVGEANRWIVHHRIIATEGAENLVIRGCNPRFNAPLPSALNRLVPRAWMKKLFRIRELRFPRSPITCVGENALSSGDHLSLTTLIRYHDELPATVPALP